MRTSIIESPKNIIVKEAAIPDIGDEEVLVKLEGTGVCASNLPVWEGREWFKYPIEPGSPGHEGYGIVAALGRNARNLSIGDKVALISYHAYAEYDKAHAENVVKIPHVQDIRPFPGEPLACAVNIFKRSDIQKDQEMLVIGAGFMGCLLIQLIKNAGAKVTVVSRRSTALEYASMAGADNCIQGDNPWEIQRELLRIAPDGFPRIIEATGFQSSLDVATEAIAVSGKLIIAGYHQDGLRQVNMQTWNWKGIDVINAHERDPQTYVNGLKDAIALHDSKILQPEMFITHYIDFENIGDAFKLLNERPESFLKAVVVYA